MGLFIQPSYHSRQCRFEVGIPQYCGNAKSEADDIQGLIVFRKYGHIEIKLAEYLDSRGITRNRLAGLVGVKFDVIDRYYRKINKCMLDMELFAKICRVLGCEIGDLLEYREDNTELSDEK